MPKKFPVAEIFGPTIQGEGIDQGIPCHFVRFGGCDFACEWCDTPHAVLAHMVRQTRRLTTEEIISELEGLHQAPGWIVLSGGNPALHDLSVLVKILQTSGYKIAVETQGTRHKEWLNQVDRLCVSPKPPSSGMKYTGDDFFTFLDKTPVGSWSIDSGWWTGRLFVKVVVFDHADYEWAKSLNAQIILKTNGIGLPFYVSAGNDAGATVGNPGRIDKRSRDKVIRDLTDKGRWLANRVMIDPSMANVTVQMQQHVLYWGNERGR